MKIDRTGILLMSNKLDYEFICCYLNFDSKLFQAAVQENQLIEEIEKMLRERERERERGRESEREWEREKEGERL
jgi:hypothetical protein